MENPSSALVKARGWTGEALSSAAGVVGSSSASLGAQRETTEDALFKIYGEVMRGVSKLNDFTDVFGRVWLIMMVVSSGVDFIGGLCCSYN